MSLFSLLIDPTILTMAALALSLIWMIKDEKDEKRPILVIALVINLFYGLALSIVMGKEDGLVPWKYDYILFRLDEALGVTAAPIAAVLQGAARIPLVVIYHWMVPMMICWYMVCRRDRSHGSIIVAYVATMVAGPVMYAILPACGPVYAFGARRLHPPEVMTNTIRLSGMPNAFPSLHIATALVFVFFAQGWLWRGISIAFLAGTALATISTGEHYVIDLVAGLAFGCFAAAIGKRKIVTAFVSLAIALLWSLAVRFEYGFLITNPIILRSSAALTVTFAVLAIALEWRVIPNANEGTCNPHEEPHLAGKS